MNRRIQTAIIDVLRLDRKGITAPALTDVEWKDAFEWCGRHQLTLALAQAIEDGPAWVMKYLHESVAKNRVRAEKQFALHASLQGFERLVLKGFAHWPYLCPNPELRTQYDLDLYCLRDGLDAGRDAALRLGYESLAGHDRFPTDHLPPMIRKTGWQWRGDYFDPDIPIAIELHFRFWDRDVERFGPRDLDGFWERRETRQWKEFSFTALCEMDSLGYACLHALRHLLRGDSRAAQFYEIAWFLDRQQDPEFWDKWRASHDDELRRIEAICFRFARDWFGCQLAPAAQEAVDALPAAAHAWFDRWSHSPLEGLFRPNKDELWLHLSLLQSVRDQAVVARRRLIPLNPPGTVHAIHVPDEELSLVVRIQRKWRFAAYVAGRVAHHLRVIAPVAVSGMRWSIVRSGLTVDYWRFYTAFVIFNLALMIFYLLYNLHLAGLGFDEAFVGKVTSAMQVGSLAGCLFAGYAAARIGLRPSLFFCFLATAVALAARSLAVGPMQLIALAVAAGICQSFWAVCLAPTVTMLTSDHTRPVAFSLTFGTGVSLGVVGGLLGGRLPALLHSTQNALLVAAGIAPLAALPLMRLRLSGPFDVKKPVYTANPFLLRFLGALAIWGAATGAFNPFFNVFFLRALHFGVERIGLVFSATQAAQVIAMLLSPLVLKRFGIVPAIALLQAATGLALAGLGVSPPALAGWVYGLYMAFQYMSEPGMYNLLMSSVPAEQRTGASALNFITLFGSQALAAWVAGEAIARYGYRPVLLAAGLLALLAARAMTLVGRKRSEF